MLAFAGSKTGSGDDAATSSAAQALVFDPDWTNAGSDVMAPADMVRLFYATAYTGLYAQAYMALDNDALMDLYRHGGAFGGLAPSQAMLGSSGNPLGISGGLPFFWSPNDEAASFLTAADDLIASNRETFDFQALLDAGRTSGTAPFAQGHPELLHIALSDTAGNFGGRPDLTIFAGATFDSFVLGG